MEAARKDNSFSEFYQKGERSICTDHQKRLCGQGRIVFLNGEYCCMFVANRKGPAQKKKSRGEKRHLQVPGPSVRGAGGSAAGMLALHRSKDARLL